MEAITKFLEDDEKILFQRSLINQLNIKNIRAIMIMAFISLFILGTSLISMLIFWQLIGIFIFLLGVLFPIFGLTTLALYLPYHKYMKILNLKFSQIKHYEDLCILTNKRWIQKSLDILSINIPTFSIPISLKDDLVMIDFDQIQSFFAQRRDSYKNYFLGFDLKFPYGQGLFVPYDIFPEFIEILKKIIPIKREVHDKRGLIYYYRE
ncbi:MAG: hypothetical protein ACFFE5_10220 [Candidatus Thorarchaeota archaeon]